MRRQKTRAHCLHRHGLATSTIEQLQRDLRFVVDVLLILKVVTVILPMADGLTRPNG